MAELVHSKILAEQARLILKPMGVFQKGRSRTWIDDHGWWLGIIEFQPSSWSRGSYLNLACMWLWHERQYISFDFAFGGRPRAEGFVAFENEEQFRPAARLFAERAAQEINRYRVHFQSIESAAKSLAYHSSSAFWPSFHAAIGCALAGRFDDSEKFFRNVAREKDNQYDWMIAAQAEAERLSAVAGNTAEFRKLIAETVQRTRRLLKLPSVPAINFNGPG